MPFPELFFAFKTGLKSIIKMQRTQNNDIKTNFLTLIKHVFHKTFHTIMPPQTCVIVTYNKYVFPLFEL